MSSCDLQNRPEVIKIATWNVNSVRARLDSVLHALAQHQWDVLALQETKVRDCAFPHQAFVQLGYYCVFWGEKTYNGVALLSRWPIINARTLSLRGDEARCLEAWVCGVRVINVYVPNGRAVEHPMYKEKIVFMRKLVHYVQSYVHQPIPTVILGDFNVALGPEDVPHPPTWARDVLFTLPERFALRELLARGWVDGCGWSWGAMGMRDTRGNMCGPVKDDVVVVEKRQHDHVPCQDNTPLDLCDQMEETNEVYQGVKKEKSLLGQGYQPEHPLHLSGMVIRDNQHLYQYAAQEECSMADRGQGIQALFPSRNSQQSDQTRDCHPETYFFFCSRHYSEDLGRYQDGICPTLQKEESQFFRGGGMQRVQKIQTQHWTWWPYKGNGWLTGEGARIDYVFLSPWAADRCQASACHMMYRGYDQPSDHVPVEVTLRLSVPKKFNAV